MSIIGNLIWLLFGGLIMAVLWTVAGLLVCITIIGIPFGLQCFKFAGFVLWPFGRQVHPGHFGFGGMIGNILWILILGWELCLAHLALGVIYCVTIIGIPFGLQHFKLALLAIMPFGARIRD
ncbi:MAG TPA: YccF domain-containing protein [Candidatus Limnocylindrales bacterium]|nr:YccF domain-containing protein [Candidatus Limnocylindrales bacterium]